MNGAKKFKSRADRNRYLHENKADLCQQKKATVKFSDPCTIVVDEATKGMGVKYAYSNDESAGKLTRTIIGNTYNYMDSQSDVLTNGVFAKAIKDNKRIYHLHDHVHELDARVGIPKSFSEQDISWRALGLGKTGMTQALFMETEVMKSLNESYYNSYLADQVDQHSVALQYVKLDLAMNDENYKAEFEVWKELIGKIGNRADAEEQGFFFAVREAKLFEVSAVLFGANDLTPVLHSRKPSTDTYTIEPLQDTQVLEGLKNVNKLFDQILKAK